MLLFAVAFTGVLSLLAFVLFVYRKYSQNRIVRPDESAVNGSEKLKEILGLEIRNQNIFLAT